MPSVVPFLTAPIARHAVWPAALTGGAMADEPATADVAFVEPLLRRRLSPQARMVLHVAHACTDGAAVVADARIVFASRHGELARTTSLLEALADGEGLSPTLFSMSVLNASCGLFSILRKDTAPVTAISAGSASFGYGLVEACLQFAEEPRQPVLFVYADEPAPSLYAAGEAAGHRAHAVALLLEATATTRVRCTQAASDEVPSDEPQSLAFLRCLDAGATRWNDGDRAWCWERER